MSSKYDFDKITNHFFENNNEILESARYIQRELDNKEALDFKYYLLHRIIDSMESRFQDGRVKYEFLEEFHDDFYKLSLYTSILQSVVDLIRLEKGEKISIESIEEMLRNKVECLLKENGEYVEESGETSIADDIDNGKFFF